MSAWPPPPTSMPHSPHLPFGPAVALHNTAYGYLAPYLFPSVEQVSLS